MRLKRALASLERLSMAKNVLKPVEAGEKPAGSEGLGDRRPIEVLRREIDRLFQDVETGGPLLRAPFGRSVFDFDPFLRGDASWGAIPAVDVVEKDSCFEITAELPGVELKDISVNITSDTLCVKGEKNEEKEGEKKDFHLSERRYGAFQRTFRFPEYVNSSEIEASFKDGVLTVILPKTRDAQPPGRSIPIKTR
jgi:HSP20 family protein